jgi:hypothetical protein
MEQLRHRLRIEDRHIASDHLGNLEVFGSRVPFLGQIVPAAGEREENLDASTLQNLEDLGNGSTDNFYIGDDFDFGECSSIVSNFSFVLQDIPNENSVDHSDSVDDSDQEDLDFMEELNYLFECEEVSI